MPGLTASQVLEVWETGRDRRPLDRALTILAAAFPDETYEALANLPIGRRDQRLLEIRLGTLGPVIAGQVECPACGERLEFDVAISTLLESSRGALRPGEPIEWISPSGMDLRFRVPNSDDLADVSLIAAPQEARRALAERCLLQGDAARLTPEDLDGLSEHMAAHDPLADIHFDLVCPACGDPWQTPFDITAYFWLELRAQAHRLLREVDALASAYGWREADILGLSAARRQMYLELAW